MAPDRAKRPPQRSGNPAVRSGVQPPRTTSKRPAGPPPKEFLPGLLPADGAPYPLALRNAETVWWRTAAGALFGLSLYLLLQTLVSQLVVRLAWTVTHPVDYRTFNAQALAYERPIGLFASNLGIATLIPISLALVLIIHHARTHWLFSVRPGMRWKFLLVCLGVSAVVFVGIQAVIVLTSPVQAAAEEIFFRGYLLQALGSLVSQPWFGVVVSSVVFALLHGTQNLPLFVDRLAFGLLAAVLVWRTGGLEAGIAAHVVNNVFAYVFAGATTGIAALKAVREIGWLDALFDVGGFAVFAVLAHLAFRALKLRHVVDLGAAGTVVR